MNYPNSINPPSSITPDSSGCPSDELIIFDQPEINVPSFQAHFPIASPTMSSGWPSTTNMKKSDSNRGKILFLYSLSILSINAVHHHYYKFLHGLYNT